MIELGHIIRAELGRDESGRIGMFMEAKLANEEPGYGYLRGKRMFFNFDDEAFVRLLADIKKPDFRSHDDLMGVEVSMELTEDGTLVGLTASGGPRRYLETDGERQSREKRTSINKAGDDGVRGRRFYACRGRDAMAEVIEALPIPEERKRELMNLNSVLARMILAENDGQLSAQKLPVF
jgi:hypothetical protein